MDEQHVSGRVTIDLAALQANYKTLAEQAPKAETGVAIKADAYGLGLAPCAKALWEVGCRSYFVARPLEGEELRAVLPEATIYVLDGLYDDQAAYYVKHRLTPSLISLDEAREWAREGMGLPCALHVDSGINRVSFSYDEFAALVAQNWSLNVVLLMSHLASSEEPDNPFNQQQLKRFQKARSLLPNVRASLANSSAHFLGGEFAFDLTRAGVALYGGNPLPGKPNPMKPVATLEARVMQLRDVPKGGFTGYNTTWQAQRDSKLAMLGAGYRDGIPRRMEFAVPAPGLWRSPFGWNEVPRHHRAQ